MNSSSTEQSGRKTILSSNVIGVLWMLVAVTLLTGMFVTAKLLMETLPIIEVGFFRMFMSLLFYMPWLFQNGLGALKSERHPALFWRAFFGATSLFCGIYAVHYMLLADATVLTFTIPLWSIIIAALFLGERIRLRRTLATLAGFTGVLFIVKPQGGLEFAALVAILGAILASCALATMKDLTRTESAGRIVFFFLFYGSIILGIPALFSMEMPNPTEWGWLVLLGFCGSAGQFCLTRAYGAGEMTIIAPFDFSRIILAGFAGYLFFNEVPDIWGVIGATIILASCVYIVRREAMQKRVPPTPTISR